MHRPTETPHSSGRSNDSPTGNTTTISRTVSLSGRMARIRQHYLSTGLSESAVQLLLPSWRSSTNKNYNSAWNKWERWCLDHHRNPISPTVGSVVDFLADTFGEGREYQSLNCYRSALSSILEPVDGFPVGRHPLVRRVLEGAFQLRPPLPKYTSFWSVDQVLQLLCSWGSNDSLTLQQLTWKLAMLLALCSAGRSSDLSRLSVNTVIVSSSKAVFIPRGLSKQSRSSTTHMRLQYLPLTIQCYVQWHA